MPRSGSRWARRAPAALAGASLLLGALTGGLAVVQPAEAAGLQARSEGPLQAATPAASPVAGARYVALGDSYSAGFGLLPYSQQPAPGCFQALEDYPHRLAAQLQLQLTDVSCSGAATANIIDTPQTTITGEGTAPPQSEALDASTELVTITIGGNDLDLTGVAASCVALGADGPLLSDPERNDCRSIYQPDPDDPGGDSLLARLSGTVEPAIGAAFAQIRSKAPNARVFVIGYPAVAPDAAHVPPEGCFTSLFQNPLEGSPFRQDAFPFTDVDTAYLHELGVRLDAVLRAASASAGFTYLSTLDDTEEHTACAGPEQAYIFGATVTTDPADGTKTPLPMLYAKLGALHPNERGVAYFAERVADAITGRPPPTPDPAPPPSASVTDPLGLLARWWPLAALIAGTAAALIVVLLVLGSRRRRRRR